jgi:ATP-dependent DNA helicase DinG
MTHIPEPDQLGLPYPAWRPFQPVVLQDMLDSKEPQKALIAPTGTGKTGLAAGYTKLLGAKAVALTKTKQLQEQYLRDAPWSAPLIGMDNFACLIDSVKVSGAPCQYNFQCPLRGECDYFVQRDAATKSQMIVTNYDYALNSIRSERSPLLKRDLLICDEGHLLDEVLTGYMSVEPTKRQIELLGGFPHTDSVDKWLKWAESKLDEWTPVLTRLSAEVEAIVESLNAERQAIRASSVPAEHKPTVQRYFQARSLHTLLVRIRDNLNDQWIISWRELPILKPVWVNEFAGEFFRNWRWTVFMSATLPKRSVLSTLLGLDPRLIYEREVPSIFPAADRPIYYRPMARMNHEGRAAGVSAIAKAVNKLMQAHPDEKILVHTNDTFTQMELAALLEDQSRVLTHDTQSRVGMAKLFTTTTEPKVLISPSMESGLDVPDLKINVIARTLWPSLGDKWVKRRQDLWPEWYQWKAAMSMIQAIGRVPRKENVKVMTYILDQTFETLWRNAEKHFPNYIKEAIIWP